MSEWVEHNGADMPDLPLDTKVQVRFQDGSVSSEKRTVGWWGDDWTGHEHIVAYRVVPHE